MYNSLRTHSTDPKLFHQIGYCDCNSRIVQIPHIHMNTIALVIDNQKEKTVLEHFFQSITFQVLILKPNFTAYKEISNTVPLCIICEMPLKYIDHLYVIRLFSNHNNTKNIPVIAYGNHSSETLIESFYESGVHLYHPRPLKTKVILEDIHAIMDGKSIKIKRYSSAISETPPQKNPTPPVKQSPTASKTPRLQPPTKEYKKEENSLTIPLDELEAVEQVMDPATTPEERILIITSRVKELLAFPFTIVKILDITQNDQTGATDLSKAIEADPVIVSTLLSVSNTVHFARRGKRISDVKEAIIRLGFVETKNIAISLHVMSLFSNETKSVGFNRIEFWYHSLACGIVSEIVARKAKYPRPEIAFICGLLHDFGIILLDEFFHSFFIAIFSQAIRNRNQFVAEEKRLWGMSHNTAVSQLFKTWNMPSEVFNTFDKIDLFGSTQAIDTTTQTPLLVNIIGMSNIIAKCLQFGKDCDTIVHPVSNRILETMNLSEGITGEFINNCIERLNIYSEFFHLDKRFFSYPTLPESDAHIINIVDHTKDKFNPYKYYFQTSGYKVTEEQTVDKINTLEQQPHAILHIVDSTILKQTLNQFLSIKKTLPAVTDATIPYLPSIIITQNKECDISFLPAKHTYCLPSLVDVNLLSFIMEQLIAEQTIKNYHELIGTNGLYPDLAKNLSVHYLDNQTVLINLQGVIRLSSFNDIKRCFLKMIESKVPNIAIQIGDIEFIDKLLINLLANFQKKTVENNCNVCFCSIGKDSPKTIQEHDVLKSVVVFERETEVLTYFSK